MSMEDDRECASRTLLNIAEFAEFIESKVHSLTDAEIAAYTEVFQKMNARLEELKKGIMQ